MPPVQANTQDRVIWEKPCMAAGFTTLRLSRVLSAQRLTP